MSKRKSKTIDTIPTELGIEKIKPKDKLVKEVPKTDGFKILTANVLLIRGTSNADTAGCISAKESLMFTITKHYGKRITAQDLRDAVTEFEELRIPKAFTHTHNWTTPAELDRYKALIVLINGALTTPTQFREAFTGAYLDLGTALLTDFNV